MLGAQAVGFFSILHSLWVVPPQYKLFSASRVAHAIILHGFLFFCKPFFIFFATDPKEVPFYEANSIFGRGDGTGHTLL